MFIFIRAVKIHISKPKSRHSDPQTCLALWEGRIATQLPVQISPMSYKLHHINTAVVVRQFSAVVRSHRAKHCCKDQLLCNSNRKPVLRLLKRRDGTRHDDDVCVFKGFPRCLPCQSKPTETVFRGKVHWGLGPEAWPSWRFFSSETLAEVKFFARRAEMWWEVCRTGRRKDASPHTAVVFSTCCQRQLQLLGYLSLVL